MFTTSTKSSFENGDLHVNDPYTHGRNIINVHKAYAPQSSTTYFNNIEYTATRVHVYVKVDKFEQTHEYMLTKYRYIITIKPCPQGPT